MLRNYSLELKRYGMTALRATFQVDELDHKEAQAILDQAASDLKMLGAGITRTK